MKRKSVQERETIINNHKNEITVNNSLNNP